MISMGAMERVRGDLFKEIWTEQVLEGERSSFLELNES